MTGDLAKMVPGFEFLQGLMKNAGAAVPGMGQWIAPTLDPDELEKRISELKTVQFWLEQNSRLLSTTIQALEVQRMTLSTLKTMNLPMTDLTEALRIKTPAAAAPARAPAPAPARGAAPEPESDSAAGESARPAAGAIDPMKWWGALTQQFTEIASQALKDAGTLPAAVAPASRAGTTSGAKSDAGAADGSTDGADDDGPAKKNASARKAAPRKASGATRRSG